MDLISEIRRLLAREPLTVYQKAALALLLTQIIRELQSLLESIKKDLREKTQEELNGVPGTLSLPASPVPGLETPRGSVRVTQAPVETRLRKGVSAAHRPDIHRYFRTTYQLRPNWRELMDRDIARGGRDGVAASRLLSCLEDVIPKARVSFRTGGS